MNNARTREIFESAMSKVCGDREAQHGDAVENHGNIACLWQAYLEIRREPAAPLCALDVAHMMVLLKLARTQAGDYNPDDYDDMAGYAGVAGDIADRQTKLDGLPAGTPPVSRFFCESRRRSEFVPPTETD